MATASQTLKARKQDFVRSEIWDAAIDLFAEKGFEETTIEDIALAAGVSRRSFFRYFASKDDLMFQGVETYAAVLTDAIQGCPRSYSPIESVRAVVLGVAQEVTSHPRTKKMMRIASDSAAARGAQLSRIAVVEDQVAQAFAARARKNSKDDLTPKLLASLTLSMLDLAFRLWFPQNQEDIAVTVQRIFVTFQHVGLQDLTVEEQGKNRAVR